MRIRGVLHRRPLACAHRRILVMGQAEIEDVPGKRKRADASDLAAQQPWTSSEVRRDLLKWFDAHHRVLPWRSIPSDTHESHDGSEWQQKSPQRITQQVFAYRVWVSEVMLQQTQVATVIKFFNAWVAKWPTVHDLAKASEDEVKAIWAGLGYYRRAHFLLKAAKHVMDELQGELPSTAAELAKIPGIGPYTSAAVASIAFGQAAAAVDGNVMRVMARLRTIPGTPKDRSFVVAVGAMAQAVLDTQRPGDFNQAVMELGATVCKPAAPLCGECPVASVCAARRGALAGGAAVTTYPGKAEAVKKRLAVEAACVLCVCAAKGAVESAASAGKAVVRQKRSHVLLLKRPAKGLLAGMWQVPTAVLAENVSKAAITKALLRSVRELQLDGSISEDLEAGVRSARACGTVQHQFTHISLTTHVFQCSATFPAEQVQALRRACAQSDRMKLVPWAEVHSEGASTLTLKILEASGRSVLTAFASKSK